MSLLFHRINRIKLPLVDKADFWTIDLKDLSKEEIEECEKNADDIILNHSSQFAFLDDRNRSLLAHSIVRIIFESHVNSSPIISRDQFSNPYLKNISSIYHLSYTKECAILGVCPIPIGLAIESLEAVVENDFWLSQKERILFKGQSLAAVWCAKRALIKANGARFVSKIEEFDEILQLDSSILLFNTQKQKVFVYSEQVKDHILAVCLSE